MSDATMSPTVHINGTARAVLIEQNDDARAAVRAAIGAPGAAEPNARDYPQGGYEVARAQHIARIRALGTVLVSLEEIASVISGARDAWERSQSERAR